MDEQPAGNSSTSFGCLKDPKGVKKIKKVTEKQSDSIIVIKIVKHFGNIWRKNMKELYSSWHFMAGRCSLKSCV